MPRGKLEERREPMGFPHIARGVFDPGLARTAAASEHRGIATPNLFLGELLRELHNQSVFDETDEHLPASIAGRKAEHATRAKAAVMLDEIDEKWLEIGSKRNRHATSDCKLLLFPLQQFAFSLDAPAITAEPAILLHHAMARDDETDMIAGTGACDGPNGPWRTDRRRDLAVRARLPVRNRLKIPPDLPLKRRGLDIERQVEPRRPAVKMRDERADPLRKRAALALDGCIGVLGPQILLELFVPVAELHGAQPLVRPRDKQTPEGRIDDCEGN